jgi:metallo-beta-lactamase class B
VPLSANAFMHVTWVTMAPYGRFTDNGLIYINKKKAVIVDTPMNDTLSDLLLKWFKKTFPKVEIVAVVVTHFHDDCIGGLRAFHKAKIPSLGHKLTNELLKGDSVEKVQGTMGTTALFSLGDAIISCNYYGPAHSPDNIVTWIDKEKILFGGCMIKALDAGRGNLSDANLQQWSATVSKVKKEFPDAKIVIPGHGDPGGIALLDYTIKMFEGDAK